MQTNFYHSLALSALLVTLGFAQSPETESEVRFDPLVKDVEGWTVHVDPALIDGEHQEIGTKALKMLANHLQRIAILVP